MAKKKTKTTPYTVKELKAHAVRLGIKRNADDMDRLVRRAANRRLPVGYLATVARADQRQQKIPPTPKNRAIERELKKIERLTEQQCQPEIGPPARMPHKVDAPPAPKTSKGPSEIVLRIPIGDWQVDGYAVSKKSPPRRFNERRLNGHQGNALARVFNGILRDKHMLENGKPVTSKEEVLLFLLEQINFALDQDEGQSKRIQA